MARSPSEQTRLLGASEDTPQEIVLEAPLTTLVRLLAKQAACEAFDAPAPARPKETDEGQ